MSNELKETSSADLTISLSFESSLKELEEVVRKLESGQTTLEEAIILYERGSQLKQHCESILSEARIKIEEIVVKNGQELGISPSELSKILPPESSY
ncbi:MAG: exodeoxyribonuclease VII small subunit [Caedimonadaceae bacterium]|nr:MAG: exodeoxyribonuclease VII small subunit [Caedimonadaceae bacterium]